MRSTITDGDVTTCYTISQGQQFFIKLITPNMPGMAREIVFKVTGQTLNCNTMTVSMKKTANKFCGNGVFCGKHKLCVLHEDTGPDVCSFKCACVPGDMTQESYFHVNMVEDSSSDICEVMFTIL